MGKIISKNILKSILDKEKKKNKIIVFTNGCFDILHRGHIRYLKKAKKCGDILVIGLNTDSSVKTIKGPDRPIIPEKDRAEIMASLDMVDYVVLFSESTPYNLIKLLKPDILVKGADYEVSEIAGSDIVIKGGGKVRRIRLEKGLGTSEIIKIIRERYKNK
ncbi:MAG: D-glycero-beta-D-manno-heptose 1-phosphate adenylyltransferase [bacterium]|nr:D-glycero-beta-D-manno-heptose 1-phosphate adenylyltransferase [bacterium]